MATSMRFSPPRSIFPIPDPRNDTISITAWLKRVQSSNALPPLITQNPTSTSQQSLAASRQPIRGPILSSQYRLSEVPTHVRGSILRQLARLIGAYDISEILHNLPSSTKKPLVGRTLMPGIHQPLMPYRSYF